MRERHYEIVLCRRERDQLTLEMLAANAEIHPGLVEQFVAYGLLEPIEWAGPVLLFDMAAVPRLRMILRLRHDTGVNLAGIGMILDLVDRLRDLEHENQRLRSQL
jgi:MerR family transcriptional regulator, heat shock protein HspR